jgi:hypothetical protein
MQSTYKIVKQIRTLAFWILLGVVVIIILQLTGCFIPAPVKYEDKYLTGGCFVIEEDTCYKWK